MSAREKVQVGTAPAEAASKHQGAGKRPVKSAATDNRKKSSMQGRWKVVKGSLLRKLGGNESRM